MRCRGYKYLYWYKKHYYFLLVFFTSFTARPTNSASFKLELATAYHFMPIISPLKSLFKSKSRSMESPWWDLSKTGLKSNFWKWEQDFWIFFYTCRPTYEPSSIMLFYVFLYHDFPVDLLHRFSYKWKFSDVPICIHNHVEVYYLGTVPHAVQK